jgi:hypothetical protein
MSKYKVGDKVKVREDLELNKKYGSIVCLPEMLRKAGKTITIRSVASTSNYRINESIYAWSDDMFVTQKPRIAEILGLIDGKKYEIQGYGRNFCYVESGVLYNANGQTVASTWLVRIIENPELLQEITTKSKRMTVAEIEKELGYPIVIKE